MDPKICYVPVVCEVQKAAPSGRIFVNAPNVLKDCRNQSGFSPEYYQGQLFLSQLK